MRICTHSAIALWCKRYEFGDEGAILIEELFGSVAAKPSFELGKMGRVLTYLPDGYLVSAKRTFDLESIDDLRPGPALRRPKNDHRPPRPVGHPLFSGLLLDLLDLLDDLVEGRGEQLVDLLGDIASDEVDVVTIPFEDRRPAPRRECGRAPSGWRSCSRLDAGSAAPRRLVPDRGTCWSASSSRAGPSRLRRRLRHNTRGDRGCRTPLRTRAQGSSRALHLR